MCPLPTVFWFWSVWAVFEVVRVRSLDLPRVYGTVHLSAPVRVMLSRVDFFEASICVDSVLEMASRVPQKPVDQCLRVDDRAGRVLHLLYAEQGHGVGESHHG
jgi:hypothetical protein